MAAKGGRGKTAKRTKAAPAQVPPSREDEPEGRSYENARDLERNPQGHNKAESEDGYDASADVWLFVGDYAPDPVREGCRWGWGIRQYRDYEPRFVIWREFFGNRREWKRAFDDTHKIPLGVFRGIVAKAPSIKEAIAAQAPDPKGDTLPF